MKNVICDECGSGDIRTYGKPQEKKPEPVYKMSDIAAGKPKPRSTFINAVMTYTEKIIECQNCGYKLEYTQNDQLGSVQTYYTVTAVNDLASKNGKLK